MVGRTNALLHSMVSSVNGKAGIVVLEAGDLGYTYGESYSAGTIGSTLTELSDQIQAAGDGFNYLGSVSSSSDLPEAADLGDEYTVEDENNAKYVYDGTKWVRLSESSISTEEINALYD